MWYDHRSGIGIYGQEFLFERDERLQFQVLPLKREAVDEL
jgi:hypothetical protein